MPAGAGGASVARPGAPMWVQPVSRAQHTSAHRGWGAREDSRMGSRRLVVVLFALALLSAACGGSAAQREALKVQSQGQAQTAPAPAPGETGQSAGTDTAAAPTGSATPGAAATPSAGASA